MVLRYRTESIESSDLNSYLEPETEKSALDCAKCRLPRQDSDHEFIERRWLEKFSAMDVDLDSQSRLCLCIRVFSSSSSDGW